MQYFYLPQLNNKQDSQLKQMADDFKTSLENDLVGMNSDQSMDE